jgi:hypothetical protein
MSPYGTKAAWRIFSSTSSASPPDFREENNKVSRNTHFVEQVTGISGLGFSPCFITYIECVLLNLSIHHHLSWVLYVARSLLFSLPFVVLANNSFLDAALILSQTPHLTINKFQC